MYFDSFWRKEQDNDVAYSINEICLPIAKLTNLIGTLDPFTTRQRKNFPTAKRAIPLARASSLTRKKVK